jgi:hypothetical protein
MTTLHIWCVRYSLKQVCGDQMHNTTCGVLHADVQPYSVSYMMMYSRTQYPLVTPKAYNTIARAYGAEQQTRDNRSTCAEAIQHATP